MPKLLKRNAVIVVGLSCFFSWSFFYAKHNLALRNVIPFGEDPYDAVGSFAVIVGMALGLLSLIRAFRPYREEPSGSQRIYLVRTQEAVVLAVFITLASNVIAMGRHPSMWVGHASQTLLIGLIGGMATVTAAAQLAICASQEKAAKRRARDWAWAASATVLAIVILSVYPERLIQGTATHLMTVIAGDFVLFAPMRPLLRALVPYTAGKREMEKPSGKLFLTSGQQWIVVMLAGALIGLWAFLAEISEGTSTLAVSRLVLVGFVFTGLGLSGFLIAYALLREPLGLG